MLSVLLFIVIFILVIGLIIISTVFGFVRSIFRFGKQSNHASEDSQSQEFGQKTNTKSKIFDNNEGEYVDYEEIK